MSSGDYVPRQHVRDAFALLAAKIAAKEGIALPRLRYREAAKLDLADGSTATLWVGDSEGDARSVCYHIDVIAPDGNNSAGFSSCKLPSNTLDLNRHGALVVGIVGRYEAVSVQISTVFGQTRVPAALGHFMIPPELAPDASVSMSIRLFNSLGTLIGEFTDITAPGSVSL